MTEILDSGDPAHRAAAPRTRPAAEPALPAGHPASAAPAPPAGPGHLEPVALVGDDVDEEPGPDRSGAARQVLRALGEPGSLAVASALCAIAAVSVGPSYGFDAYPFNQGITSLQTFLVGSGLIIHPLHDYLASAAPNIVLGLAGLLAGVAALLRGRTDQLTWARPVAAGALLASLLVTALLGLGAYRASTYDLAPTSSNPPAGASG